MAKEQLELLSTPPKTLEFLRAVIADPTNPIQQVAKLHAKEMLSRGHIKTLKLNVMAAYLLTPADLEDVGELYGITREGVRQSVVHGMHDLWEASSAETKAKFDGNVPVSKERGKLTHRQFRTIRALLKGETPKALGLSEGVITFLRNKTQKLEIEIPGIQRKTTNRKEIFEKFKNLTVDEEIKEVLERKGRVLYEMQLSLPDSEKLVLSVREAARGFVYYLRNSKFFVNALKEAGIPVAIFPGGRGETHIIAGQHLEQAKEVFRNDPNLEEFKTPRVQQVAGPKVSEMPSTFRLTKNDFKRPRHILRELGIEFIKGFRTSDFLGEDCPVTVFKYRSEYYFAAKDESALKEYLKTTIPRVLEKKKTSG